MTIDFFLFWHVKVLSTPLPTPTPSTRLFVWSIFWGRQRRQFLHVSFLRVFFCLPCRIRNVVSATLQLAKNFHCASVKISNLVLLLPLIVHWVWFALQPLFVWSQEISTLFVVCCCCCCRLFVRWYPPKGPRKPSLEVHTGSIQLIQPLHNTHTHIHTHTRV